MSAEAESAHDAPEQAAQARKPVAVAQVTPFEGPRHTDESPTERLARKVGNRNFSNLVARMENGDGILPGGRIHPDVEHAIAAVRGGGRTLERDLSTTLSRNYEAPLDHVRVHTGEQANALARAVSARAFTVGSDIFFADGEYAPGTSGGRDLIAHEVAHTVQNIGAPAAGPLTVTQPGDAHESAAEAAARDAFAA